jgi:rubredoxin
MGIKKTIHCDECGAAQAEVAPDAGWPGWGAIHGVVWDGVANPSLCPACLGKVMAFIDKEKHYYGVD